MAKKPMTLKEMGYGIRPPKEVLPDSKRRPNMNSITGQHSENIRANLAGEITDEEYRQRNQELNDIAGIKSMSHKEHLEQMQEEAPAVEPVGAQLLRRIHDDYS